MWLLVGSKTKAKKVDGGQWVTRHCDTCGETRTFVECDVKDSFSAFFIKVIETTQRRMVCMECGDDFSVEETMAKARAAAAASSPPAKKPSISEAEKDRMLAELKKKMGR